MIRNRKGAAAVEYVLVAVIVGMAAAFVLGPGSMFFGKVGQVYRVIAEHVAGPGNHLLAASQ